MAQALADRGNQDQVVIAQDVTTEAHKRYAAIVLDDLMVLLTARANAYLYEVFTDGVGVRLYLDIEHSAGDHSSTDMLNDVAAAIAAGAAACGYVASGVWFTTASGPSSDRLCGKASFHGVAKIVNADCDEVFFPSTAAVKAFVMRFIVPLLLEYRGRKYDCAGIVPVELPHQSGDTGGAVDLMPYGHNQCFRLTFHGKLGSSRILKPYEGRLTLPRGMERREEATLVGYYGPPLPPSRLFPEADARAAAAGAKRAASAPATQRHEKKPRSAAADEAGASLNVAAEEAFGRLLPLLLPECFTGRDLLLVVVWIAFHLSNSESMVDRLEEACKPHVGRERGTRAWIVTKRRELNPQKAKKASWLLSHVSREHSAAAKEICKEIEAAVAPTAAVESSRAAPIADETYNEPWVRALPIDKPTLVVSAAMGTGKTTALVKLLKSLPDFRVDGWPFRVLVVTCRRALARHLEGTFNSNKFYVTSYLDEGWSRSDLRTLVQVESLWRLLDDRDDIDGRDDSPKHFDLVVLDESESVLKQLSSHATHGDNMRRNHHAFEYLVSKAERVVAMDALTSGRTIDCLAALRGGRAYVTRNLRQPTVRKAVQLMPYVITSRTGKDISVVNKKGLAELVIADLVSGKNVVMVATSRRYAKELKKAVKENESTNAKTIKLYCSESSPWELRELGDVERHWGVNLLIYTPTVSCGTSYDKEHFHSLYLYASAASVCTREVMQMLKRVRSIRSNKLTFVIEGRCPPAPTTSMSETEVFLRAREVMAEQHAAYVPIKDWVRKNHTFNVAEDSESRNNYASSLLAALAREGYTVTQMAYLPEGADTVDPPVDDYPAWGDVRVINASQAESIERSMKHGEADRGELFEHKKFRMTRSFARGAPPQMLEDTWASFQKDGAEAVFWHVVCERRDTIDFIRSHDTEGHHAFTASSRLHHREALVILLDILGMHNSHVHTTIGRDAFALILPRLQEKEGELRVRLGLRPSRRKARDALTLGNAVDLLYAAFGRWGISVKRFDEGRKRGQGPKYGVEIGSVAKAALWAALVA